MRTNNPSLRPAAVLKRVGDVDTEGVDNPPWLGANEVLDINWEASPISCSDIMLNNRAGQFQSMLKLLSKISLLLDFLGRTIQ